jgi:electron transport complex protein RnfC
LPPATAIAERPCIRCGDCDRACPVALPVLALWDALRADDIAAVAALRVDACRSCGDCDRACPSDIPLAARLGEAQARVAARRLLLSRAAEARTRYQLRGLRLERDAREQAERDAALATRAVSTDAVAAAIARAQARRARPDGEA